MMKAISVRGARTHNLKNVSLDIPRDKLTVITGLSGSGKSSLAFDTLYAEGSAATWRAFRLMRGSSLSCVRGPTSTASMDFRLHRHRTAQEFGLVALGRGHRHRNLGLHEASLRPRGRALLPRARQASGDELDRLDRRPHAHALGRREDHGARNLFLAARRATSRRISRSPSPMAT